MRRRRQMFLAVTAATVIALGAGGCGDDDDDAAETTGTGTTTGQVTPTAPEGTTTAAEDAITGGETRLDLSGDVADAFSDAGIEVTAVDPATSDDGFRFPITGGGGSIIEHEGGLRFAVAGAGIEATDFRVDLGTGELTADIEGTRVPLLLVDTDATEPGDIDNAPVYLNRDAVPLVSRALEAIGQSDQRLELGELTVEPEE